MNGWESRRKADTSPRSHLYSTPRRFAGSLRHIAAEIERRGRHQDSSSSDSDSWDAPRMAQSRPVSVKQAKEKTAILPSPREQVRRDHSAPYAVQQAARKGPSPAAIRVNEYSPSREDAGVQWSPRETELAAGGVLSVKGEPDKDFRLFDSQEERDAPRKTPDFRLFDSQLFPSPAVPGKNFPPEAAGSPIQEIELNVSAAVETIVSNVSAAVETALSPKQLRGTEAENGHFEESNGQHRDARSSSVGRKPPASAVAAELRQREERLHSVPDVIKTRNASFPVVRSAHGPLQDVEGVIVHAPETFSSQLFEEYGGKILMVDSNRTPIPVLSAAAVGACGLVVVFPSSEPIAPKIKESDAGIPVVGISERHARRIHLGEFASIIFDSKKKRPPSHGEDPLSQSAPKPPVHPQQTPRGNDTGAAHDGSRGRLSLSMAKRGVGRSPNARSFLWDSDSDDEEVDSEFLMLRRRRLSPPRTSSRHSSPRPPNPRSPSPHRASPRHPSPHHASPRRGSPRHASPRRASPRPPASASSTPLQGVRDSGKKRSSHSGDRDGDFSPTTPYVPRDQSYEDFDDVVKSLEYGEGVQDETEMIRGLVRSLMTQDAEGMAGYLMRIEASAPQLLPNTAMDRFVVQFVSALGKCFAQNDVDLQQDAQGRLRELCRQRGSKLATRVVSAVACYPHVLRILLHALEPGASLYRHNRTEGKEKERRHQARLAVATVLRHIALDPAAARALSKAGDALGMLGAVLLHGTDEEVVHKIAACTANAALEYPPSRRELCNASGVLEGLGRLLLTDSQRCIASALAALSNISLDSELAWKVARQLHIPRLVMLLLSGTNKAKHRGAGLVRNLLLAEDTRQRLVQRGPGLLKALQQLKRDTGAGADTQKRASVALSLLIEQLQKDGGLDNASMVEMKLMNSKGPLADHFPSRSPELGEEMMMAGEPPRETSVDEKVWARHGEVEVEAQVVSVMGGQDLMRKTMRYDDTPPKQRREGGKEPRREAERESEVQPREERGEKSGKQSREPEKEVVEAKEVGGGVDGKERRGGKWVWRGPEPGASEDDWIGWDTTGRSTPRERHTPRTEDTGVSNDEEDWENPDERQAERMPSRADSGPIPKPNPPGRWSVPKEESNTVPAAARSLPAKKEFPKRRERTLPAASVSPESDAPVQDSKPDKPPQPLSGGSRPASTPSLKSIRSGRGRERSGDSVFRLSSDSDSDDVSPLPVPRRSTPTLAKVDPQPPAKPAMHPAQQPAPDAQLQGTVQPPTRNTAVAAQAEESASSHGRDGSTRAEQPEQATLEEDAEAARSPRPEAVVLHHRITPQKLAERSAALRSGWRPGGSGQPTPRSQYTPRGGQVTPQGGQVTPRAGQVTPRGGQVTPRGGQVTPRGGQITPRGHGQLTPRSQKAGSEDAPLLTRKEASGSTVDSEPVYISAKQETSFDVDESLNVSRTPRSMVVDKVEGGRRLRTDEAAGPGPTKEEDEKKHETEDEIQEEREPCDVPVTDASLAKIARMLLSGELEQVQEAANELTMFVDAKNSKKRGNRREIAMDTGVMAAIGQLLEDGIKVSMGGGRMERQLLEVLREVCEDNDENVRLFVASRPAAGGVLQVLRRCRHAERRRTSITKGNASGNEGGSSDDAMQKNLSARKRIAGALVALCVVDDQDWKLLCTAREQNKLRAFGEWARGSPPKKAPTPGSLRKARMMEI